MNKKTAWFLFGLCIVLTSVIIVLGRQQYRNFQQPETQVAQQEPSTDTPSEPPAPTTDTPNQVPAYDASVVVSTGTDDIGTYDLRGNGLKDYTPALNGATLQVTWNKGAIKVGDTEAKKFFDSIDPQLQEKLTKPVIDGCVDTQKDFCVLSLYDVGKISSPGLFHNDTVYRLFVPEAGMGIFLNAYQLVRPAGTNKIVLITDSPDNPFISAELQPFLSGIVAGRFPELTAPELIHIPGQGMDLVHVKTFRVSNSIWDSRYPSDNRGGITNILTGEHVKPYPKSEIVFTDNAVGPVYYHDNAYHVVLPDGAVEVYDVLPYFLTVDELDANKSYYGLSYGAIIDWNQGINDTKDQTYNLGGDISTQACAAGITPGTSVVDDNDWFHADKLVAIGKTKKGELVYESTDAATSPLYKKFFDFGYAGAQSDANTPNSNNNLSTDEQNYQTFLADHPMFFWKDFAGHWRVYFKAKYRSLAECGKPVIYLYPEQDEDVHVQIAPNLGLTKTEPQYEEDGWFVHAMPTGELFSYNDKKMYPYLFWEGHAGGFDSPQEGFVMKRAEVPTRMVELLKTVGLNEQETKDFLDFWQDKLTVKPYVFVTFVPQTDFSRAVPLKTTPQADTVIRVFMDYTPLQSPKVVKPLELRTPERKGFTVVEWGGTLGK